MHSKSLLFLLFTALVIATVGCSDKVQMRGKVTFSDDNSPLTVGQVTFRSETSLSRANLKPDGTYVLGTDKETDGIPKGTYEVSIDYTTEKVNPDDPMDLRVRQLIAPFERKTVVVDGKTKVYDMVVERAP